MTRRSEQSWTKWRKLVAEQARSGQSVAAFCREHELPAPHFFFWKKRLREAAGPQFVEVQVAKLNRQQRQSVAASSIEVRLGNGRSLVVAPEFDASHLRALLAVVESES
jgi:transposase-like protein